MLLVEGYSEAGLFGQLSNHVFASPYFRKYISYECHLFLEKHRDLKFNRDFKYAKKNQRKKFVSEKIVSELVALSCLY